MIYAPLKRRIWQRSSAAKAGCAALSRHDGLTAGIRRRRGAVCDKVPVADSAFHGHRVVVPHDYRLAGFDAVGDRSGPPAGLQAIVLLLLLPTSWPSGWRDGTAFLATAVVLGAALLGLSIHSHRALGHFRTPAVHRIDRLPVALWIAMIATRL